MTVSFKELRNKDIDQLIEGHNSVARSTQYTVEYYLNEIQRREQLKHEIILKKYTFLIAIMTFVMMVATIVNVILFFKKLN